MNSREYFSDVNDESKKSVGEKIHHIDMVVSNVDKDVHNVIDEIYNLKSVVDHHLKHSNSGSPHKHKHHHHQPKTPMLE